MPLPRRTFLSLPVLGLAPLAAMAGRAPRIGWLKAPNDLTLVHARGMLDGVGAPDWSGPFSAAAPAIEALNAGAIDVTAGSSTAAVTALAAGVPLGIFGYQPMAAAAEAILVPKTSAIAALKGLAGKRVAVNRGGTGEYLLMRALARHGIPAKAVTRVYLSPADSFGAFAQGAVDAWATWDPFVTLAQSKLGARVLADGAAIGSENAVVLLAHRRFVAEAPLAFGRIARACHSANLWSLAHKGEAGAIWAGAMGLPPALGPAIGRNGAMPTGVMTDADVAQMQGIAAWYKTSGLIAAIPDIGAAVVRPNR